MGPLRAAHHGIGSSIGFGSGRAHQVRNTSSAAAASVHARPPPLLPVNHYAELAEAPAATGRREAGGPRSARIPRRARPPARAGG